ncbi:hypothetical protein LCGC14_2682190, partial [marine sediment metagenome]
AELRAALAGLRGVDLALLRADEDRAAAASGSGDNMHRDSGHRDNDHRDNGHKDTAAPDTAPEDRVATAPTPLRGPAE